MRDQQIGPIAARDLRRLARIGKINPQTEVRLEADGNWVAAGLVPGLFSPGKGRAKKNAPARQNAAAAALAAMAETNNQSAGLEDFDPEAVVADHHAQADEPQAEETIEPTEESDNEPCNELDSEPDDELDLPLQLGGGVPPIQIEAPPLAAASALPVDRAKRLKRQINLLCVLAGFFSFVAVAVYPVPALPIVVGLLAVTLAVRALGKVDTRSGIGFGLPAVATVLSLFALAVGVYTTFFYHDGIAGLQARLRSPAETATVAPTGDASAPPVENGRWHSALGGPLSAGDVELEITSVEVGPLDLGDRSTAERLRAELGESAIYISLKLGNRSTHRKLDYTSWSGAGGGAVMPSLVDNFGNRYQRVRLRGTLPGVKQVGKAAIYPGKQAEDTLVFQAPVESARELRLALPLLAVGDEGELRVEIPRRMIGVRQPAVEQLAQHDPAPEVAVETEPDDDAALLDFQRDTKPAIDGDGVGVVPPEDENLDHLARKEPDFLNPGGDFPAPGEALRNKPPREVGGVDGIVNNDIVDNGKFIQSPFGNEPVKPRPERKPLPAAEPIQPVAGRGVIDPVLPLHGRAIARPDLVTDEDLAPPRDDPFRNLAD